MKILAGAVGGLLLAMLGSILVGLVAAGFESAGGGPAVLAFFVMWGVGLALVMKAPRPSRAWRQLLVASSVCSFLLPIAGLAYTGVFIATQTKGGAAITQAAVDGGMASVVLGFVGFFAGVVFLVIGLLVDKEASPATATAAETGK